MVWHAMDLLLDTEVAVKVVKPNLAMHRRFRSRFAREVALSTQVVHPFVVPVHDTGLLSTGEPYVVLGYALGGSLADLLRLRPPVAEVLRLLGEVLEALAAIHSRGLLHQDLKPANVLLHPGTDGQVHAWVADLGVADTLAELNRDRKGISGTPGYMAPEQLRARTQELGPWTDLYAVGLMLFEVLAGERPHPGEGRQELLDARMLPPPAMPLGGDIGPALAELVRTLLDPDPRQRFDRAADARNALRDAMRGVSFQGKVTVVRQGASTSGTTGPILLSGAAPLSVSPASESPPVGTPRWNRAAPGPMPEKVPDTFGWQAPARASLALFSLREVPLVGRTRERQVLWAAAREVVSLSQPRVVLVVGERGSGKTRLLESIATSLEEGGWMEAVRLRYHSPAGMEDGYRGAVRDLLVPWNDTRDGMEARLIRWLSRDRQVSPDEVLSEASLLTRWCGYVREGEGPVSDAVGLAYLYRYLDAHAWRGGSCLILQDVHHATADGDGLAIAEALLDRTVGERPVLVVASLDADALSKDPMLRMKVEGLQERGAIRMGLRRLDLKETRQVVHESLELDPGLARLVAVEYEGSPLSAGLLLRDWALRRLLEADEGGHYRLRAGVKLTEALPPNLEILARRRLEAALASVPDAAAAREAVFASALAGVEPPAPLIRAVNEAGLDAVVAAGLVADRGGYIIFEHARLRDAAVEMARRTGEEVAIHRKLATAWEGLSSEMDVDFPVGMHRLRSDQPETALGPLLASVRRMNQGGRARTAIRAAALAIEAADRVGQAGGRLEARRLHAEALVEVGEPERALPLVEYALAEVEGDRLARARLRVLYARAARKLGRLEDAARELEAAWQIFQGLRDRQGLIEVAGQRARLARQEGRDDDEVSHWGEVLRLNRGDLTLEAEARNGVVQALVKAGKRDTLDAQLRRLESVSRVSADVRRIAEATWTTALVLLGRRELDEAEKLMIAAGAIAATLGADNLNLRCRTGMAEVARFRGDYKKAEEVNRQVVRFARERRWPLECAAARVQLALVAVVGGDRRAVEVEVEAAEMDLAGAPRHALWLHVGLLRALLGAEVGDERTCRAWWAVARERGLEERHIPDLWMPMERLGQAAQRHGWEDIGRQVWSCLQAGAAQAVVDIED